MTFVPDTVWGQSGFAKYTEGVTTLTATDHKRPEDNIVTFVKAKRAQTVDDDETWDTDRPAPSLNAFDNGHETRATVLAFYPHTSGRNGFPTFDNISPTITVGTGIGIPSPPGILTNGVRRLTPLECERLMGWPDNWTKWDDQGVEQADSHRYRQCGNGVVASVALWIGQRLMEAT